MYQQPRFGLLLTINFFNDAHGIIGHLKSVTNLSRWTKTQQTTYKNDSASKIYKLPRIGSRITLGDDSLAY
ncbi:hypothetical protein PGTUg99_016728 [Puccinia graminis f. sp. tritici]|uniref:Uncharacterized protein n=1 Tax=Puccinia graminis f. sp. tritici TaxID=56615 RepID=A0A5B0Q0M7_PUCGR|nr:hypothetical protein PGTUg99_016728 [Puccinia graminis f. sp. tritici]